MWLNIEILGQIIFLIAFFFFGKKQGISFIKLSATFVALAVMSHVGCQLLTFDAQTFADFLRHGILPRQSNITSIGAFVIMIPLFLIINHFWNIKGQNLFILVLPLLVLLSFQRINCTMAGCCFGLPTESWLALQQSSSSILYHHHQWMGWLSSTSDVSLPVHPFPIYMMIWSALIAVAVWKWRTSDRNVLLCVALFLGGRLLLEFLRDPASNHQLGTIWMGMKHVQWILLAITLLYVALAASWPKERRRQSNLSIATVGGIPLLVLAFFHPWFEPLQIAILTFIGLLPWLMVLRRDSTSHRWIMSYGSLAMILLIVQSQSTTHSVERSLSFEGGAANLHQINYPCIQSAEGCIGSYCAVSDSLNPFGPWYVPFRIKYGEKFNWTPDKRIAWDIGLEASYFPDRGRWIGGITAVTDWHLNYAGVKAGFRYHKNYYPEIGPGERVYPLDFRLQPVLGLRLGKLSRFNAEYTYGQSQAMDMTAFVQSILLRYNLNDNHSDWRNITYGIESFHGGLLQFASAEFKLGEQWWLEPRIGAVELGDNIEMYFGLKAEMILNQ